MSSTEKYKPEKEARRKITKQKTKERTSKRKLKQ